MMNKQLRIPRTIKSVKKLECTENKLPHTELKNDLTTETLALIWGLKHAEEPKRHIQLIIKKNFPCFKSFE